MKLALATFAKSGRIARHFVYGREVPVAAISEEEWRAVKWLRKLLQAKGPSG